MSSLRRDARNRSPYWFACFTLPDGRRTTRSTGVTDKRAAQRIANEMEDTARAGAAGTLNESGARTAMRTIGDIYRMATAAALPGATVGDYLNGWLKAKDLSAGESTAARYASVIVQFMAHLGPKARQPITCITKADVASYRDALAGRVAVGTANLSLKILRVAFGQAVKDGLVDANEAAKVDVLKRRRDDVERRAFTLPELRRILEAADAEWRGMILAGLYTGQRLGDLAGLTWQNVDLQRAEIRFVTTKTGRQMILPMAPALLRYVESLPSSDDPAAPLFPRANTVVCQQGRTGTLSNQFYSILVAAGMAKKRSHKAEPDGKGRSTKRTQNEVSFHCLRHTATSLLKAAGAGESVAMEFIGHDSASISRNYTHLAPEAMQSAANQMPDITQGAE
jgi:integrase